MTLFASDTAFAASATASASARDSRPIKPAARQRRFRAPGSAATCVLTVAALIGAAPAWAAPPSAEPIKVANVEVTYRDPASFTEMRRDPQHRTEWQSQLGRYLAERASRRVPAGQHLDVTVTDVQLAGVYELGRPGRLSELRVVRDNTPPRIDLTFQLASSDGAIVKEGARQLRDINFLERNGLRRNDQLAYEKNLIDDWLRREFDPKARK